MKSRIKQFVHAKEKYMLHADKVFISHNGNITNKKYPMQILCVHVHAENSNGKFSYIFYKLTYMNQNTTESKTCIKYKQNQMTNIRQFTNI